MNLLIDFFSDLSKDSKQTNTSLQKKKNQFLLSQRFTSSSISVMTSLTEQGESTYGDNTRGLPTAGDSIHGFSRPGANIVGENTFGNSINGPKIDGPLIGENRNALKIGGCRTDI
ncbi:hypothetical protein DICVIV_12157 [Dictyocaulus viviparus]|uniref:Uncharacterized protein n=1 Tax=Dictyocaulus viviparus TaxID=29172 RepID=A0A0D8XBA3_DICVI|nr:hypothetical protein DICVIV_12157 [Dictyocaulus viviparus]